MGEGADTFATLLGILDSAIEKFPDTRKGKNKSYSVRDATLSAFSVFFTQSPSFLSFQRSMELNKGNNNGRTLFGIDKIPCDNQIRNILDPVSPEHLCPVFDAIKNLLQEKKILEQYRSFNNTFLIPLDGTYFFSSGAIHCPSCSSKKHRDGTVSYFHSAITPVIVAPGNPRVIALAPEFISPQDGAEKQDCENAAAKRWIARWGPQYAKLGVTILGDDLYCKQPVCELLLAHKLNFILTCKPSSHPWLSEWLGIADPVEDLHEFSLKVWTGKEQHTYTYRYANQVPLKDGEKALQVNWAELIITNQKGEQIYRNSFATNHLITRENVEALVAAGRCRWKIENENNNTLKTKGYHLEHNFGHGKQYLSNLLLTLNLLAFLFHTVLEIFDQRYRLIRHTLSRRDTFFHDIRALTRYICFDGWTQLLQFMLRGLELEDPGG